MVNYKHSKVYKLVSNVDPTMIYVGSTTQSLAKRKALHKYGYKRYKQTNSGFMTSYKLYDLGAEYVNIVLIENCPCTSKEELAKRERYYIETLQCVNKIVPGRSRSEYYQDHKTQYSQYYEDHKVRYINQSKEYREKNKIQLQAKASKKYTCQCGGHFTHQHRRHHERTRRHQKFVSTF